MVNSLAIAPVIDAPVTASGAQPVLDRIAATGRLVTPTARAPRSSTGGVNSGAGGMSRRKASLSALPSPATSPTAAGRKGDEPPVPAHGRRLAPPAADRTLEVDRHEHGLARVDVARVDLGGAQDDGSGNEPPAIATRSDAVDANATTRPSAEIAACPLDPFACVPAEVTDTSVIVPVVRSFRNTSAAPFSSPGTRLDADDSNATYRPSAEIAGADDGPSACSPEPAPGGSLTRVVTPAATSRT